MAKKRYYVGLASTYHDPAIAIVNSDGNVLFAEATERALQNKRAFNSPPDQIFQITELLQKYCEPTAELVIASTWSSAFRARAQKYISALPFITRLLAPLGKYNDRIPRPSLKEHNMLIAQQRSMELAGNNIVGNPYIKQKVIIKHYEHHLAHAAAACYTSPFAESVCAIIDGFGEWKSSDFFHYNQGQLKRIKKWSPFSVETGTLGGFYGLICVLCGFEPMKGEEWKVMGLASYGHYDDELYKLLRPLVQVNGFKLGLDVGHLFFHLDQWQELKRDPAVSPLVAANLAYTGQFIFEEVMETLLHTLYAKGLSENLTFGGGCALNSSWNGQITQRTQFKKIYIPCAPSDDGCALGAALLAYYEDNPTTKPSAHFLSPYLGSAMSQSRLENLVKFGKNNIAYVPDAQLYTRVATLLADGKIVGWIQGRAEFGPRALGNRSILADPRQLDMTERINAQVKFREEFRPFAPSILHEFGEEYFENYQESPYMERTLKFKLAVKHKVPAVVHINDTGRLQTVKKEWSERYYALIKEFYKLTGIPLLLNTSFNIMGKPIAHSVEDAIALFYTTGLDVLVIDNYIVEK